jgi:Fur family ferric uptake transcriptional regulator
VDSELRDRWLDLVQRRVAGANMRSGAVRLAVAEWLARDGQCLVTVPQIVDGLRDRRLGSQASVYRVVEQLFSLGLLRRVAGGDGIARYEIADPQHHHHHVVDEATGDVVAFTDRELEAAIADAARRLGFELVAHDVILRGERLRVPAATRAQDQARV